MNSLTAKPGLLKQANLSLIRKVIKSKGTATRAEIADETKISSTTVRSLLTEMLQNGEIESVGYDESSGGRKAERYGFRPDLYHCAVICVTDHQIHSLLVNICGEIMAVNKMEVNGTDAESAVMSCLDRLTQSQEIRVIGLGVPGIVDGRCFWRGSHKDGTMCQSDLGELLEKRYQVPVFLENDLNATAIGFERCYRKEFPCEDPENTNMAYLYFEKDCISAGFIAGGRVIRGAGQFAGELSLIPMEQEKLLGECMSEPMSDVEYVRRVIGMIGWICGILNPQYVTLGGPALRKDCIGPVSDGLCAVLPKHMQAEILYSPDGWQDYYEGMAYVTAAKMFDEVQFIKE